MELNTHGGDVYSFKNAKGRFPLDFSSNVNPCGLPRGVRKVIKKSIHQFSFYPDINCEALCKAISQFEGIKREHILCGNGADDLIYRIVYALTPRKALLCSPTFTEYEMALRNINCEIQYYDLSSQNQFLIQEDILEKILSTKILFICNPNNPSGQVTSKELLIKILRKCHEANCILVMDECFGDFLEQQEIFTMKKEIVHFNNLIVLKAFTKTYAFAGLRLGYCLSSNLGLLRKIFVIGQPWSVSIPAQIGGIEALKDKRYLIRTKKNTCKERRFLKENLEKLKLQVFDGCANYLMFQIVKENALYDKLFEKEILIRKCENFRGLNSHYYRIAVKSHKDNVQLIKELKNILEK